MTFLFTDIEGSTRRWEADAERMRLALAAHDEVLRKAIEAHGGWLFKHTGDGVCAVFGSPRAAVLAAVAAQRELDLPVRMGIATGDAELRGQDYFGVVLNRATRVMASGHGGQILIADSTAGLLSGVNLVDLGSRRFRDLPAPVQVFQVQAEGLRTQFPPLRALDTGPGNLRRAPTSFVGRESEIGEVQTAVKTHQVVTLTGVGGVGKTRLALEVAGRLVEEFSDGVWLFELASVTDPLAVPDAVASVLSVTQQPGRSVTESVAAALEGRRRLLVFDNCEHVLDAAADLIDAIVAVSPTVSILATSREGLGVDDEQLWQVPSLDVDAGVVSAAVELFTERAHSVAARFSMSAPEESAAVVEICRRLDGIPLAIELAASRMASMTAIEVLDRLDQRFRLLVGSRRGMSRHHTLRHAVAWSYDLLDETEKELLDRCSVFTGGFDLHSVCAVVGGVDDFVVLDLLDALVRKSLLVTTRVSGRTRFSMLETIRQFASERLDERGQVAETRTAHARYYASREPAIWALWDSPRQLLAYELFATELSNLRTAFRWSTDHGDLDTAAVLASCSAWLGYVTETYETLSWAEELIEPARAADHPRLGFLCVGASLCWNPGRIEAAVRYADIGREVIGDGTGVPVPFGIEGVMACAYLVAGQPERLAQWCHTMIDAGRDTHTFTRSGLLMGLALSGSTEEALAASHGLIDAAEATDNPCALAVALHAYGLAIHATDRARSFAAMRRGMGIAQDSGSLNALSGLAAHLCSFATEHDEPLVALEYFPVAITNYQRSGNTIMIRTLLGILAALFHQLERYEPAATIAGFASGSAVAGHAFFEQFGIAISHLLTVLGEETYESLTRKGERMTTAETVTYAFDQIDRARTELEHLG
jgi:predicted ATPase